MKYELYKKLKDAGFKQEGNGIKPTAWICDSEHNKKLFTVYIPTLSELIEACGKDFGWLALTIEPYTELNGKWVAQETGHKDKDSIKVNGDNPEIAVANLWLALNKK